ncbi:hypothetical protein [Frankia sp. AvcI1]|nr:hypothetical protein [Frankia sp. AvcI1]
MAGHALPGRLDLPVVPDPVMPDPAVLGELLARHATGCPSSRPVA